MKKVAKSLKDYLQNEQLVYKLQNSENLAYDVNPYKSVFSQYIMGKGGVHITNTC